MLEAKIRTEKVHVEPEEAYDYERKIYCCPAEGCGFETEDEGDCTDHYGEKHASKEEREVNGIPFHRFEAEADQKAFVAFKSNGDGHRGWFGEGWEGPGWYGVQTKLEPCPRGCCKDFYSRVYPASHFEEEWSEKRDKLNAALDQLQPLLPKGDS